MMNKRSLILFFIFFATILILSACKNNYTPKPKGYHRIELPEHNFQFFEKNCPFKFPFSTSAEIKSEKENCWFDIYYPNLNGEINMTYKALESPEKFKKYAEDTYELTFTHTKKASAIEESIIKKADKKVYGILYNVSGNAASPIQFFLTDSFNHFLRGSVYFNCAPNPDSLAPLVDFMNKDVLKLIEDFEWK